VSLFWRPRSAPTIVRQQTLMPLTPFGIGSGTYSDITVSTLESSMQSVAVHATVDLIASLISELPVDVFRRARSLGEPAVQIDAPAWVMDPEAAGYGVEDYLYKALVSFPLRGNVWGRVGQRAVPQQGAFIQQVEMLHPDRVRGQIEDGQAVWYDNGERIPPAEAFHRRAYPVPGVVSGLSVIANHARSIGLDLTLTQFGLQFFQDGGMPGAVLRNEDDDIDEPMARRVKSRWLAAVRGNREPAVLGKSWTYTPIAINPEEGQFLESRQMSSADCARMFGPGFAEILGYESSTKGGSLTYANLQSRETHLLVFSLARWLRRCDRLLSCMLPSTQYAKLNRNALLETTAMERFQAYALALGGQAWMNVDEVRALEDRDGRTVVQPSKIKAPKAGSDSGGGTSA
jgi:HK97 family phage portal protein